MSSVDAIVKDGVIVNNSTATSDQTTTTSKINDYKEQFMKLLCAQMKYQDPLEPTSNTEYISQYAQFTQVEQMQNLSDTVALSRASDMVGKTVQITQTDESTGEITSQIEGKVDFVTYTNGKSYVSINGNKYSVDDVTAVVDETYYNDTNLVSSVRELLDKLPAVDYITLYSDQTNLENMLNTYNSITGDVSSYFSVLELSKISQYALKYADLLDQAALQNQEAYNSAIESVEDESEDDTVE